MTLTGYNLPLLLVFSVCSFVSASWHQCSDSYLQFKNGELVLDFHCGIISTYSHMTKSTMESSLVCKGQQVLQDQPIYKFSGTTIIDGKAEMAEISLYSTVSEPKRLKDFYGIIKSEDYFYYLQNSRIMETETLALSHFPKLFNYPVLRIGVAAIGDISLEELKIHLATILDESNIVLERNLGLKVEVVEIRLLEGNEPWMRCGSNLDNQIKFAKEFSSISAAKHWHIFYKCPINLAGVCESNGILKNNSICFESIESTHDTFLSLLGYRLGATKSSDSTIMDPKSKHKKMEFSEKSKKEIEKNFKYISRANFYGPLCSGFNINQKSPPLKKNPSLKTPSKSFMSYVWNFLSFLFTPFSYLLN